MNRIIDVVMLQMKYELSANQCENLESVLVKVLSNYEIQEVKHELQCSSDFYLKYVREFAVYLKVSGKADSTIKQYVNTIDKFFNYCKKNVQDVKDIDIRLFLTVYEQCRKVSKVSLDNMRRNISAFFNYCVDLHYIDINPARTVKPIKAAKTIKRPFSKRELTKIESAATSLRNKAIVSLLKSSGIRVSELVSLNRKDLDFQSRSFYVVGKGLKEREVCFSDEASRKIQEYLLIRDDNNPALFLNKNKERLSKQGVEAMIKKLGALNGIHAYPHRFRRTLITTALDQKMQPHLVAAFAGHSSIETTMIYCTVDNKRMKRSYRKIKI